MERHNITDIDLVLVYETVMGQSRKPMQHWTLVRNHSQ
jgi:hypothetical protein